MTAHRPANVCCGLVPHLELALHPERRGQPVVIGSKGHVLASNEAARAAGVRPGLRLRQAEAICPGVVVAEPQPEPTSRLANQIAAELYDLAPVVEVRIDGHAWLDLDGVARPGQVIREARRRLQQATQAEPRLGLAPGPFTAALAAARARPGHLVRVEHLRPFLSPLPVTTLELGPEQLERLELLGLRTLGQLAAIGPRQLESQLGPIGREAALLARGEEPRRLRPWRPPQVRSARRQFDSPVEDREALLFVARALTSDLAAELGPQGAGAKRVRARLWVEGQAEPEQRESLVRHPLAGAPELFGLVRAWLREWRPAAPVTELAVELPELEAAGRRQLRLWMGGDGSAEEVEAALERLQERWGVESVLRLQPILPDSPLTLQRYVLEPRP